MSRNHKAHRCRKTSRFTSGENLRSRSPSERYFHKLEYAHMFRTHLWPRPYAPLSNNWQGPIHSRSTMISFPRACLIYPYCLSDNCNSASGKKIGSSLQFMCDHLSYATSRRIQSRNAPSGEARSEEKRQRRLYLQVSHATTYHSPKTISETQKFPKQSPIRLVPLVYDQNSLGCLYIPNVLHNSLYKRNFK